MKKQTLLNKLSKLRLSIELLDDGLAHQTCDLYDTLKQLGEVEDYVRGGDDGRNSS